MRRWYWIVGLIVVAVFSGCSSGSEDSGDTITGDPVPDDPSVRVLKTGQTKSYDENGAEVLDGSLKDDGYYQMGVDRDYTRDDANDIVTDNITGLMWQDDAATAIVTKQWVTDANYADGNYTDTSGDTAMTYCENLNLGAHTDWRMPSEAELLSITDLGRSDPAIDPVFQNAASGYYWSATTIDFSTNSAWYVYMYNGLVYSSAKSKEEYVWPVRDG